MESPVLVTGGPVAVEGLAGATGSQLAAALRALDTIVAQVEACRAAVFAEAEQSGAVWVDGHRRPWNWVAAVEGADPVTAKRQWRRGLLLAGVPGFADALRAGRVHLDHVDILASVYANPRCGRLLGEFVEIFVQAAATLSIVEFRALVRQWESLADEDGTLDDQARAERHRAFHIRRHHDGTATVTGTLTAEHAAIVAEVHTRYLDAETRLDWADARARLGGTATVTDLARTGSQRSADAFVAVFARAAATPRDARHAKPLVNLVVDHATVEQWLREPDTLLNGLTDPHSVVHRICRTIDGDPLTPAQMIDALLVGRIRAIVVDAAGNPIAVGKPGSLFSRRVRDAMRALNLHCRWPGCHVRSRHLDADHLNPRNRGGPTCTTNLTGDCNHHNTWRHTHHYTLWRDQHGHWHITRPDGTDL